MPFQLPRRRREGRRDPQLPEPQLPLLPSPGLELEPEAQRRVELTVACRDADAIPKVADAGQVRTQGDGSVQVMHEGSLIVEGCYHGAPMTEVIRRLRGHHDPQQELVIHSLVERLRAVPGARPPVVMELGCAWGYNSIWLMRALGARAVLVEPDPGNLAAGRANLELNNLAAETIQAAVGGAQGTLRRVNCESDGVEREVPVVSVAGLLDEREIDQLDVLLLDVRGAELDVIEGSADLFKSGRVRFVVASTHHHSISGDPLTHQRCLDALEAAGAHVIAEHSIGESCSPDGLIAVSFEARDRDFTVPVSHGRYRDSLFGELEPELDATQRQRDAASAELDAARGEADAARAKVDAARAEADAARTGADAARAEADAARAEADTARKAAEAAERDRDATAAALEERAAAAEYWLAQLQASTSWRLTAPLRAGAGALSRFRPRSRPPQLKSGQS